jgi:hypothetical protein
LLVAYEDELDLGIDQGVENRHRSAARQAEDVLDTFRFHTPDQPLCAGEDLLSHVTTTRREKGG